MLTSLFVLGVLIGCSNTNNPRELSTTETNPQLSQDNAISQLSPLEESEVAIQALLRECNDETNTKFPPNLWYENRLQASKFLFECQHQVLKAGTPSVMQWSALCSQTSLLRPSCNEEWLGNRSPIPLDQYLKDIEDSYLYSKSGGAFGPSAQQPTGSTTTVPSGNSARIECNALLSSVRNGAIREIPVVGSKISKCRLRFPDL